MSAGEFRSMMDFDVGNWEADATTDLLAKSLFESSVPKRMKMKKRKPKVMRGELSPAAKKRNVEVVENTPKRKNDDKIKKSKGVRELKDQKGNPSVTIDSPTTSQPSLIPKKSRRNKFKNPDWKNRSDDNHDTSVKNIKTGCNEGDVNVKINKNFMTKDKPNAHSLVGNTAGNLKETKRKKSITKICRDKKKKINVDSDGRKKQDKTDGLKIKKQTKRNSGEQVVMHDPGRSDIRNMGKPKQKQIKLDESSESDFALDFNSEGSMCGSDIELGSDLSLSNSENGADDIDSIMGELKKIRGEAEFINMDTVENSGYIISNISKEKLKIVRSKVSRTSSTSSDNKEIGQSSESDDFLTPQNATVTSGCGERQKSGVCIGAQKLAGSQSSSQKKVKSPFDIKKLKTILRDSQTDTAVLSNKMSQVHSDQQAESTDGVQKPATVKKKKQTDPEGKMAQTEYAEVEISGGLKQKPSLADRMKQQLTAARFRYLNEQLYTSTGKEAYKMMSSDKEAFNVYHDGFQCQVSKWPENPVDRVIRYIKKRPKTSVVADFGCGDAKVACSVPNEVHSFDLVAKNKHVTACNMANVPMTSDSVDIAVFCLSLMGTNLSDFIMEANRVLKTGGILLVAEVKSRFDKIGSFTKKLEMLGFTNKHRDLSNKMFVWFEFTKTRSCEEKSAPNIELYPCVYKKR